MPNPNETEASSSSYELSPAARAAKEQYLASERETADFLELCRICGMAADDALILIDFDVLTPPFHPSVLQRYGGAFSNR